MYSTHAQLLLTGKVRLTGGWRADACFFHVSLQVDVSIAYSLSESHKLDVVCPGACLQPTYVYTQEEIKKICILYCFVAVSLQ